LILKGNRFWIPNFIITLTVWKDLQCNGKDQSELLNWIIFVHQRNNNIWSRYFFFFFSQIFLPCHPNLLNMIVVLVGGWRERAFSIPSPTSQFLVNETLSKVDISRNIFWTSWDFHKFEKKFSKQFWLFPNLSVVNYYPPLTYSNNTKAFYQDYVQYNPAAFKFY